MLTRVHDHTSPPSLAGCDTHTRTHMLKITYNDMQNSLSMPKSRSGNTLTLFFPYFSFTLANVDDLYTLSNTPRVCLSLSHRHARTTAPLSQEQRGEILVCSCVKLRYHVMCTTLHIHSGRQKEIFKVGWIVSVNSFNFFTQHRTI